MKTIKSILLSAKAAILLLTFYAVTAGAADTNVPVLYMTFDSVGGSTVTNGGSGGSAMNGTITGSGATVVSGGRHGSCLSIPSGAATANYVLVNNTVVPFNCGSSGGTWSWAMWIKTSTAGGAYLYQGDGAWNGTYPTSGDTSFYLNNGGGAGAKAGGVRWGQAWQEGTSSVNDGNWHHIAMTCTNGVKMLYVDGNVDSWSANSWGANNYTGQVRIGGSGDGGDGNTGLNGLIDEVAIYNVALNQTQIQNLMANGFTTNALAVVAAVNPASGLRGQAFTVTATVTPGGGTVTNVSVDLSAIGGSASASLAPANATVYTNTFTVPSTTSAGAKTLTVTVTDNTGSAGSGIVSFTVLPPVWTGGSLVGNTWSDSANWLGNVAPLAGDSLTFAGTTRLTPDMNSNYSVSGLVFSNTAGGFVIGSSTGTLTNGSGGIVNNSASTQTLNVPLVLSAEQTFNTAAGSLTLNSNITGSAALTKAGNGTLTLAGAANVFGDFQATNGFLEITGDVLVNEYSGANSRITCNGDIASGGVLTATNTSSALAWFPIGDTTGGSNSVSINGGNLKVVNDYGLQIARLGNASLVINSGSVLVNDNHSLGLSLSEGAGRSEVDLNGGTLAMIRLRVNGGSAGGTATLNFNGGTLTAIASRADFIPNSAALSGAALTANVRNGGAVVDTAGFDVTIGQPLLHSAIAGDNATDGGLTKAGNGTLTFTNANTYTGNTTISAGTLALGTGGSLSSANIKVTSGTYFDVSALASYTLNSGQNLEGSGQVNVAQNGLVAAASSSAIYPGTDGTVGNLTINGGLTLNSGATANFDLSTAASGANDQITVNGTLTLNGNSIHIKAPSTSSSLDTTADYVLINAGGISGSFSSTPVWEVKPVNWANYTVVTSGSQVALHYSTLTPPTGSGVAIPSTAMHNQNVLISVTVTNGSGTVDPNTGVVLNAGTLDGSLSSVSLVLASTISSTVHIYTNTIAVPGSAAAGAYTLSGVITDSNGQIGTANIAFNVSVTEVWNGGGTDQNWSTNPNWVSGLSPDLTGNSLIFAGTAGTAPNMDNSYSVNGLTFSNNAASFNLGTTTSGTLTLTANGVVNNSPNAQTLNVPVVLSAAQTLNAAAGDLTLGQTVDNGGDLLTIAGAHNLTVNGDISGAGGLTKTGNGALTLAGNNSYSSPTLVNAGVVNVSGSVINGSYAVVGNVASNAVLEVAGTLTVNSLLVGNASGAAGAVYQTAGSMTISGGAGDCLDIGNVLGGFGYFNASGGSVDVNGIAIAGEANTPTGFNDANLSGNGIMEIDGGTVNNAGWLVISRTRTTVNSEIGVLNVYSGSLTYSGGGMVGPWGSGGTAIINILGGSVMNTAAVGVYLGNTGNTGILNLNGGLLEASEVAGYNGLSYSPVTYGQLNFNGGKLQASAANGNFMRVSSAKIFSGGATIDDGGNAVTIAQPLLAPTGRGVHGIASFTGGAGYIAPPIITITNGVGDTTGTGATAIAQINPVTGVVTNIIITCPGVNYTAVPTFLVSGGGAITAATITGTTPTANTSGGLTKIGSGTLTLSGANTYTGNTTISAGTLELTQATLASNSTVSLASSAVLKLDFSTTNTIGALVLNGVSQPAGIYGSSTPGGYITGTGYLQVPQPGPSAPASITSSVTGNGSTLSLAWPAGQGWRLQMQTNSLFTGLGANWSYLTDGSVSSTNIAVDPAKPTVFYRLTYP